MAKDWRIEAVVHSGSNLAMFAAHIRAAVAMLDAGSPPTTGTEADVINFDDVAIARRLLRARRARDGIFPKGIFADPAWDMLLDLYVARKEGRTVSISSICIASAVPSTTALRWLGILEKEALIARQADPKDGRRIFTTLTDLGYEMVQQSLAHFKGRF
jgi:hypothetical protein